MKTLGIARVISFSVLIAMVSSSTLVVSAYSVDNTGQIVSQYSISETVQSLQKQVKKYGLSLNYTAAVSVAETDASLLVLDSNFISYINTYGKSSFHWNLAYNARESNLSVYFQLMLERGKYIVDYLWGASSNGWVEVLPNVTVEQNTTFSSNSYGSNWAGYTFYDAYDLYELTYTSAGLNVSTVSQANSEYQEGMGAWIGFSLYANGSSYPISNNNTSILAQTGYARNYTTNGNLGPYYIWYETLNDNSAPPVRYGGSPDLSPGYALAFSITYNTNATVTYGATIVNTSQFFTSSPQNYEYGTEYAQYIVEAPGDIQIAKFSPTVVFQDATLSGPYRTSNSLNNLYSNGYYINNIMNQTAPTPNQNVINNFEVISGWGEPEMTYNNSNIT